MSEMALKCFMFSRKQENRKWQRTKTEKNEKKYKTRKY